MCKELQLKYKAFFSFVKKKERQAQVENQWVLRLLDAPPILY